MECHGVKAILFDLDNTLIDTAGAGRVAIQKVHELLKTALGHENTTSDICQRFAQKLLHESYGPSVDRAIDDVRVDHWHEAIQEAEGKAPSRALASECYHLWKNTRLQLLALSPEVRALLEELGRTHTLLLLTNGETQTQREKIQAAECESVFGAMMVVGGEHAEEKPAASVFKHCFALLGVQARDCVVVGDSLGTDILGGFNAGVRATVWINSKGESPPEGSVKPDYTIPSVLDLANVLAELK